MLRDYYTLIKLKCAFQKLVGMKLIEIFSQEKNSFNFIFFDEIQQYSLNISVTHFNSICYLDNKFSRSKNNSADVFPNLLGEVLQNVNIFNDDRILELNFIKYSVFVFLFGGANSNLLISDTKKCVIYTQNNSEKYINKKIEIEKQSFLDLQNIDASTTIFNVLTKSKFRLNKYYANEFLFRENILAGEIIANLDFENVINKINNFIKEILESPKNLILESAAKEILFSLIPLKNYKLLKEYDDINEGIKKTQIARTIAAKKHAICKELLPKLKRDEKKILDNVRIAENLDESLERAENYRCYAELLLSQSNIKSKFNDEIQLEDWAGNLLTIKLDAKLNLIENAQKYYKKSKKVLTDIEIKQQRLPKLKEKLQLVQAAILTINNAKTMKDLNSIREEVTEKTLVVTPNKERDISTKFRKFDIGEGYILYVGKNAANNEELTLKFAKPNDIWLHSRGSSGSHCVVKLESGGNIPEKLPKNILKTAAEVAAYYSGAKNSKYTPVCYTQKKYVHKPKGANLGSVVLQREDIIMVEPKLPAEK